MPETFWSLFHDVAHWEFELFVGLVETIVIDVVGGLVLWKRIIKPYWEKKRQEIIQKEHEIHGVSDEHN